MRHFGAQLEKTGEVGMVQQIHAPIVIANGLPGTRMHEIVVFESGQEGEVFSVDKDLVQILVFSTELPQVGTRVTRTDEFPSIAVGEELLGHIISPLCQSLSSKAHFSKPQKTRPLEVEPLGISERARITTQFLTGIALVDVMIPLGKGQKELILGDRRSDKNAFLLETVQHQVEQGSVVVYAAIGKKKSEIKIIEEFLKRNKLTKRVVVVASTADDSPSIIYLTPYAAMSIAEYFRDLGQDTLVVFDDLATHAKFYREISLIARRFPGRDSYPGDIFYAHAKLMERAGNFKTETGEVSITALPVADVTEGDLTGFIPTNLMSMTDGHIFFDYELFTQGRRPAINIALSVTRVGRQTQNKLMQNINQSLTSFLAEYENVQNLTHFGAELTEHARQVLVKGESIYAYFEQDYLLTTPFEVQIILLGLIWEGLLVAKNAAEINDYRIHLTNAYGEEENKELFTKMLEVTTLDELGAYAYKHHEELVAMTEKSRSRAKSDGKGAKKGWKLW